MKRSSLVHTEGSGKGWSRRAKLASATSAFVLTSFAAVSNVADSAIGPRLGDAGAKPVVTSSYQPVKVIFSAKQPEDSSVGKVARQDELSASPLDAARFNERFGAGWNGFDIVDNTVTGSGASMTGDAEVVAYALPEEAEIGRREQSVRSSIEVFSYGAMQAEHVDGSADGEAVALERRAAGEPRRDLLEGVPDEYVALVTMIAAEERVDPNLMLSIMRVENAGFDPQAVSSAGAIGLMQVMPKVGEAFGASDLTDPAQNIRAGARFLRVLVDKYKNPVLIASAYNAGEPKVDVRRSLPLIQETADYVTRVVGLYTNTSSTDEVFAIGRGSAVPTGHKTGGRSGRAERAKSSMLVFSVGSTVDASGRAEQESGQVRVGGPVKIKKEEVLQ